MTKEDIIECSISALSATMIVVETFLRERKIEKYAVLLGSLLDIERTSGLHLSVPMGRFFPHNITRVGRQV